MSEIAIIGCGGSGCNIVSHLVADGDMKIITLNVANSGQNVTIPMEIGELNGCMGDPVLGCSLTEDHKNSIMDSITGCGIVMVVSVLGGGVGSGAVSVVLESVRRSKKMSVALIGIPMSFEGSRRSRALDQLQKVVSEADRTIVFDMNQLGKIGNGEDMKFVEILEYTDQTMCDSILRLKEMLQGPFFSTFNEKAYTISYSENVDPIKAATVALNAGFTDSDPCHGKIIANINSRLGSDDKESVSTAICNCTGIVPDIIFRDGAGNGMMLFIPIAYRTL